MEHQRIEMDGREPRLTRRRLLQTGVALGVGAPLLRVQDSSAHEAGAGAAPRRGGGLRVALATGGPTDTLDPNAGVSTADAARSGNLFDRLAVLAPDGTTQLELAKSFEPNKRATVWTLKLRPGVTWHDGKPLTVDDVMYTLRRIGAPKSTLQGKSNVSVIRLGDMRKLDALTLEMPLTTAVADLPTSFTIFYMAIVQNGAKSFKKPVGTGPFMFSSFTPGQSSVFTRNPHYWKSGRPYLDRLTMQSITDPSARLNALLGGQVDCVELLQFSQAKSQLTSKHIQVLQSPPGNMIPMTMAVDQDPFRDARVREAFRLIVDRKALVNAAQVGFGAIGNDLFGKGQPMYAASLPQREQDLDKAKSLLKAAGKENLSVTLDSSSVAPGMLESATAFAEQAKGAGVKVQVNNIPAGDYYGARYLKYAFGQTQWASEPLAQWIEQAVVSKAPYNETHWRKPAFDKLVSQARGELDDARRKALYATIQKQLWDSGGYIVWGFTPWLDGLAKNVRGAVGNGAQALGNYQFRDFWLA